MIHTPCWYAVQTRSNQEKIACGQLLNRGLECMLPTYETVSQRKERRVMMTRPLFPGYLFVKMPAADKLRAMVASGVVSVLCNRPVWDAIDEHQVACLQKKQAIQDAEPHEYLPIGRKVTIVSGPFVGLEGVLIQHRSAKNRVVVSLPAIMSAFSIEVEPDGVRESVTMNNSPQAAIF
jgi:transcription termination/antitermination protein NusG